MAVSKPRIKTMQHRRVAQPPPDKGKCSLARVSPLTQNPHAIRDTPKKVLEVAIGHEVRMFRKNLGITVADLAGLAVRSQALMGHPCDLKQGMRTGRGSSRERHDSLRSGLTPRERGYPSNDTDSHVWTAPADQGCVFGNGTVRGRGHVSGLLLWSENRWP